MSRTQALVRNKFNDYFDRLQEMSDLVAELKKLSAEIDDQNGKAELHRIIDKMECEIDIYAKELKTGGMEIIQRVA